MNLRPRPRVQCGEVRDRQWQPLERRGLGMLGRAMLCERCEHGPGCFWPKQYSRGLAGAQVIYATQAHLKRNPGFVAQCADLAGARRVLTIMDEVQFAMDGQERVLSQADLKRFVDVLGSSPRAATCQDHDRWLHLANLLLHCSTEDLRAPGWWFPGFDRQWTLTVQEEGWRHHGEAFQFLAPLLQLLARSAPESRERLDDGSIRFAMAADPGRHFMVFGAQAPHALTEHRLGRCYANPFAGYGFEHPGTVWYNLASRIGMQCYFRGNAPQILDFFAQLIVRRVREGRRVVCIAKKSLMVLCANLLQERLSEFGLLESRVMIQPGANIDLADGNIIPLINYGAIGTNRYEHHDCVYCLTSYYVPEIVVGAILQDLRAADFRVPISVRTEGNPPRRIAEVTDPRHRIFDVASLVQEALEHCEMGTVLQAVGRVRPFTQPREVITFQCGGHPTGGAYTQEFTTLNALREHFGIPNRRQAKQQATAQRVQQLRQTGLDQKAVVERLGIGLRTVQRYWEGKDSPKPLVIVNSLKDSCRLAGVKP